MDAIILAAGNSVRFGENKLLHEINDKPMFEEILEKIIQIQDQGHIENVIVVAQHLEVIQLVEKQMAKMEKKEVLPNRYKEEATLKVIRNKNPELGISHSIKLGIEVMLEIGSQSEACMFVVSDQPYLQKESLVGLITKYHNEILPIGICGTDNRLGNPVIFSSDFYEELSGLNGDKGGKQVVMQHLDKAFIYQVLERELEDIDVRDC